MQHAAHGGDQSTPDGPRLPPHAGAPWDHWTSLKRAFVVVGSRSEAGARFKARSPICALSLFLLAKQEAKRAHFLGAASRAEVNWF